MKQIVDSSGAVIRGMFKTKDGAIVINDKFALDKAMSQSNIISSLNNEVNQLKEQMKMILEKLNGNAHV
jgi:hypothetical protein